VLAMNRVLRVRSRFVSAICLKVERGDVAGAVVDEALGDPAGSLHEARDLFARGEEDVIPGGRKLSVADAEALDAAHSSACPVACVVAAREFRSAIAGVVRAGQDPPPTGGNARELPEQVATLPLPSEEAEVVPEQQDRVEALACADRALERSQPRVGEPRCRATSTASGETSIPTTSCLRLWRCRPTRPAPPRSSTLSRTNLIARRSCDHHDRNGAR
jgi:hypothetical protein